MTKDSSYLISLWTECLLQWVQNFLSSRRAVVLRRFFIVVYLETPGDRLAWLLRHSVHSKVIIMRTPFLLAIVLFLENQIVGRIKHKFLFFHTTAHISKYFFETDVQRKTSTRLYNNGFGNAVMEGLLSFSIS